MSKKGLITKALSFLPQSKRIEGFFFNFCNLNNFNSGGSWHKFNTTNSHFIT